MTLPIVYGQHSPAIDFYNRMLSSVYHYQTRIYDPDYGLTRDPDYYEKIIRNPDIYAALQKRWHDVAGRRWIAEPYSEDPNDVELASITTDALKQIRNILEARVQLAQACLKSRSYASIVGQRKHLRLGNQPMDYWWVPTRLDEIDKRRIDHYPIRGISRQVIRRLWSVERQRWEEIVNPELLVEYIYDDDEARLGYGRGLGEALYFYSRFCSLALENGLQALERYAQGLVVVTLDGLRVGSKSKTNDDAVRAAVDQVTKHRSEHVLVFGDKDKVEVKDLPAGSHSAAVDFVTMLTESMVRLILGSTRPTGGGEGGSLARTVEESEQTESLLQFDRSRLDEVLSHSVVDLFLKVNQPMLVNCGLGEARPPRFATTQEKREDYSKNTADLKVLCDAGVKLKADEVYKKINYTKPGPTDELLAVEKPAPAPSPFGMPPDMGGGLPTAPGAEDPGAEPAQVPSEPDKDDGDLLI
jgi:hypothetical protein